MTQRADTKPLSYIGKSDIAKRADQAEARAEAKREAEEKLDHVRIVLDYGVRENGVDRDATPEEQADMESWMV